MDAVNFAELDELAGELLPERTVLSTVTTPFNNWNPGSGTGGDGGSSSSAAASGGGSGVGGYVAPDHGFSSTSACNANDAPQGNNGLLGLFQTPAENSQACQPATSSGSY